MARHLATVGLLGGAFCALWSVGETLAGWYLMEPSSVHTPADQFYLAAPLSQWIVLESFDQVADCEAARREAHRLGRWQRYPVCIATNDPRLASDARPLLPTPFWFAQVPVCRRVTRRPLRSLGR
jgi:hypothetical protein